MTPRAALAVLLAGCGAGSVTGPGDARHDAPIDAYVSTFPDAGPPKDAAPPRDAAVPDARLPDALPPPDARIPDARPIDAGIDAFFADARTCAAPVEMEVLANGDFDDSTGTGNNTDVRPWVEDKDLVWDAARLQAQLGVGPQSGGYAAYLGGYLDANDVLYQPVTLPAGTIGVRLSGYRYIITADATLARNSLRFQIVDASDALIATLRTFTNVDRTSDWVSFSQPLLGSFPASVRLRVIGATDNTLATRFLVDTLSLKAIVCP